MEEPTRSRHMVGIDFDQDIWFFEDTTISERFQLIPSKKTVFDYKINTKEFPRGFYNNKNE